MDRVFKSKVGWWYHLAILLIAAGCVASILKARIDAIIISLLIAMLVIHILLNTWYKITEDGMLIAHCSIFPEKKIAISEISAIGSTVMPISSYALSLDRLIIYKSDKYWLLISPVDKKEFINQLKKINPAIKFKDSDI
jgi:Mn2+/Fe2+ NRAMP family transporter